MPQISVDYSPNLEGAFDRRALGVAINRLAVKTIDAKPEACKTLFRRSEDVVVGESEEPAAQVYVQIQIFPGRTPEAKAALSEGVQALLAESLAAVGGGPVHTAVSVEDLDRDAYRSATVGG